MITSIANAEVWCKLNIFQRVKTRRSACSLVFSQFDNKKLEFDIDLCMKALTKDLQQGKGEILREVRQEEVPSEPCA